MQSNIVSLAGISAQGNETQNIVSQVRGVLAKLASNRRQDLEDWFQYGKLLKRGRERFASDKLFGQWIMSESLDCFPEAANGETETIPDKTRYAALWFAENEEYFEIAVYENPSVTSIRGLHERALKKFNSAERMRRNAEIPRESDAAKERRQRQEATVLSREFAKAQLLPGELAPTATDADREGKLGKFIVAAEGNEELDARDVSSLVAIARRAESPEFKRSSYVKAESHKAEAEAREALVQKLKSVLTAAEMELLVHEIDNSRTSLLKAMKS